MVILCVFDFACIGWGVCVIVIMNVMERILSFLKHHALLLLFYEFYGAFLEGKRTKNKKSLMMNLFSMPNANANAVASRIQ